MPWVKGQSGNLKGRPPGYAGLARYIREQTNEGKELVELHLKVLRAQAITIKAPKDSGEEDRVMFPAISDMQDSAEWLACRGFGRVPEVVEPEDDEAEDPTTGLSDEELTAQILETH